MASDFPLVGSILLLLQLGPGKQRARSGVCGWTNP